MNLGPVNHELFFLADIFLLGYHTMNMLQHLHKPCLGATTFRYCPPLSPFLPTAGEELPPLQSSAHLSSLCLQRTPRWPLQGPRELHATEGVHKKSLHGHCQEVPTCGPCNNFLGSPSQITPRDLPPHPFCSLCTFAQ